MQKRSQTIHPKDIEKESNAVFSPKKRSYSASSILKTSVLQEVTPTHSQYPSGPGIGEFTETSTNDNYVATKAIFSEREENLTKYMSAQLTEQSRLVDKDNEFSWYSSNSATSRHSEGPVHLEIPDNVSHSGTFETTTVKALEYCRKTVLRPYLITLSVVGWRRFFSHSAQQNCLQRTINLLYPLFMIFLLILLYIVSVYTCKNGAGGNSLEEPDYSTDNSTNSSVLKPFHCQHMLSLFFIPYFLHLLAYLYALYSFRVSSSENIDSLMEMAFVLSSRCQNVHVLNKSIILNLLLIMVLCVCWQVSICMEQAVYIALYVVSNWKTLEVTSLVIDISGAVVLKIATGVVFIILILHYTTQCALIISLARGIKQGLQEKSTSLSFAMRDMYMCKSYLGRLNREAANSVSLCLISIIIYLFIDAVEGVRLFTGIVDVQHPLEIVYLVLDSILWTFALTLPMVMAARVQSEFVKLRNMTFGIYLFRYKDSSMEQISQFFYYANSITYKVRLFNITVRSSFISLFFLTSFFAIIIFLITNSKI